MSTATPRAVAAAEAARPAPEHSSTPADADHPIVGYDGAYPIVECVRTPDRTQLTFECPYCRRGPRSRHPAVHVHGACAGTCPWGAAYYGRGDARARGGTCSCPPGSGDGHRVEHCSAPDSPFHRTGYVLREVVA